MALLDDICSVLSVRPRSSAAEISQQLVAAGKGKPTRSDVNSELYRNKRRFVVEGQSPPRWSLQDAPSSVPHDRRARRPAAVRGESASVHPPSQTPGGAPERVAAERAPGTKAELIAAICAEIGIADLGIGPGSTEPKSLFTEVVEKLGLAVDRTRSKPELGEAIARAAGRPWTAAMDSRGTPSGGGDTVTAPGLRQVLAAVQALKAGVVPPNATVDLSSEAVDDDARFGLAKAGAGLGTKQGSGGEGPVHRALKAFVRDHPLEALGEPLVFLAEDLVERTSQALGDEISFVTGDRVDLLMQDGEGRFVVIEVEPTIGSADHIGFHQAAKYWVLVAVANGIQLDDVRRLVVATKIDPTLAEHYSMSYGIEPFEVTLPEPPRR